MKQKFLLIVLAFSILTSLLLCLPVSAQAEAIDVSELFDSAVYTDGEKTLPYRIYLPNDYDPDAAYPLIFFFHGAGERGNDNQKQLKNAIGQMFASPESPVYGCIVVAPQCPSGKQWVNVSSWSESQYSTDTVAESEELELVLKLLDELKRLYSIDSDRVYASGLSMGGYATWDLLVRHTDLFAAGIPVCGGADYRYAERLKDVPIYTFHGLNDPTVPYAGTEKMVNEIRAAGGERITYITYPSGNHFIWEDAFSTVGLYDWLLSKRLSDRIASDVETETSAEGTSVAESEPDTEGPSAEETAPDTEAPSAEETEPETEAPSAEETEPETEAPSAEETEPETEAPSAEETEPDTEEPTEVESSDIKNESDNSVPDVPLAEILIGILAVGATVLILLVIVAKRKK